MTSSVINKSNCLWFVKLIQFKFSNREYKKEALGHLSRVLTRSLRGIEPTSMQCEIAAAFVLTDLESAINSKWTHQQEGMHHISFDFIEWSVFYDHEGWLKRRKRRSRRRKRKKRKEKKRKRKRRTVRKTNNHSNHQRWISLKHYVDCNTFSHIATKLEKSFNCRSCRIETLNFNDSNFIRGRLAWRIYTLTIIRLQAVLKKEREGPKHTTSRNMKNLKTRDRLPYTFFWGGKFNHHGFGSRMTEFISAATSLYRDRRTPLSIMIALERELKQFSTNKHKHQKTNKTKSNAQPYLMFSMAHHQMPKPRPPDNAAMVQLYMNFIWSQKGRLTRHS